MISGLLLLTLAILFYWYNRERSRITREYWEKRIKTMKEFHEERLCEMRKK